MVNYCRVLGCTNRSDREKHLEYYRLPKVIKNQGDECKKLSEKRRREWLAKLHQNFSGKNIDNIRVCSAHFISGKKADLYQSDSPDWVPTLNMVPMPKEVEEKAFEPVENMTITSPTAERFQRRENRSRRKLDVDAAEPTEVTADVNPIDNENLCKGTQTDLTGIFIEAMANELQNLRTESFVLRSEHERMSSLYEVSGFEGKDEKVQFFTGFPRFQILMNLFLYLSPYIPVKKSLSKFQVFILTLMRLRLNVSTTFLAYAYNVSTSTASRVFADMINVMYVRMKPLIIWPEREQLRKTMPLQFREHFGKKCAVIIDCFEVFIDRPSNLKARAETWSSYKHHNTVKFLIGITPQGTVSFLSNAWGGRVSDKYITEHCGFLDNILPGDVVLADRGFDIKDTIGCKMAKVEIPAFTKGKSQLSALDVETTRQIAHVRIHVERVIGCVRQKYTILSGQLPVDFLTTRETDDVAFIDKISTVCCACVNLSPSAVDFK